MLNLSLRCARSCLLAVLGFLAVAGTAAQTVAADYNGKVRVGGATRSYGIHVPDGPAPASGFPVILAFHGGGGNGMRMRRLTNLDVLSDERRFISVYPDGIDKHWNDGRKTIKNPQADVGFIAALLDQLQHDYAVDRGRIYATGLSNGALFVERLGCDLSQRIAAIAPVAGTLPADTARKCRPARPVAVMQIDGTADPIMPFDGGAVADFGGRGEGGNVLSVGDTVDFWSRRNGCDAQSSTTYLPVQAPLDRTRITRMAFSGCPASGQVTLMTVIGGGHAWPGGPQFARPIVIGWASRQMDASRSIVDFFLTLPRR